MIQITCGTQSRLSTSLFKSPSISDKNGISSRTSFCKPFKYCRCKILVNTSLSRSNQYMSRQELQSYDGQFLSTSSSMLSTCLNQISINGTRDNYRKITQEQSISLYQNKVSKDLLSILVMRLHHILETMMTYPNHLRKPSGSHCERLWNVKYNPNVPEHLL